MLLGEPKHWETPLQLLVDLLRTNGKPDKPVDPVSDIEQLPVIACNMDLQFMERACIPRFLLYTLVCVDEDLKSLLQLTCIQMHVLAGCHML